MRRLPLLALAAVSLLAALWTGLLRLGLDLPQLRSGLAAMHGPVFVLGFLGTQIGLERAVALRRGWPYVVPSTAGAGSLWLILGLPETVGQSLISVAGVLLVLVYVAVHRMQPSRHNIVMGMGAVAWAVGAIAWLAGASIVETVPWLVGFLVLTIVGERLELSRTIRPPEAAQTALLAATAVYLAGAAIAMWISLEAGIRVAGAGLLAQALWLGRFDVARRTVKMQGATRFMAIALIAGYVWLAVGAVTWISQGAMAGGGGAYDAMLHAIFVGFVFSMIFAHAPIIVPAVLGVALPYRASMYVPLALLHASLLARLIGDATENATVWRTGGAVNELAIVMYLALAASSAVRASRAKKAARGGRPGPTRSN
ncbi:MAG: hypothetical protein HY827_07360 [Actinobacteria bacterium]|nr:hypothetical protein [Actinomycetota bacterium]